jgi:hypothetical protein
VIKDFPRQSHFHFRFIRPLRDTWQGQANDWLKDEPHHPVPDRIHTAELYRDAAFAGDRRFAATFVQSAGRKQMYFSTLLSSWMLPVLIALVFIVGCIAGSGWWVFLLAGAVAMAIALFTVSLQTIRAALANPVKSLKSE